MYRCVVIGGGPSGLLASIVLKKAIGESGKVILISNEESGTVDGRCIVISAGSRMILMALEIWNKLSSCANKISRLYIEKNERIVLLKTFANDLDKPEISFELFNVVESEKLSSALRSAAESVGVDFIIGFGKYVTTNPDSRFATVTVENPEKEILQSIQCDLVLSATGCKKTHDGNSFNVKSGQDILTAVIKHESRNKICEAFEKFSDGKILTVLPISNTKTSIISTLAASENADANNLFEDIKLEIEEYVGENVELEKIKLHSNFESKIGLRSCKERNLSVGDAAHSFHPIGARGYNQTIYDLWNLFHDVRKRAAIGLDIGSEQFLKQYSSSRVRGSIKETLLTTFVNETLANPKKRAINHYAGIALFKLFSIGCINKKIARNLCGIDQYINPLFDRDGINVDDALKIDG